MKTTLLAVTILALVLVPAAFCSDTGTSTLNLTVGAEASFLTTDASTNFSAGNGKFASRTATTNFSYKIRTSTSGTGTITVQLTAFESGGPAMTDLTYGCTVVSPATGCGSSGVAVSTSSGTNVATFGNDAHSVDAGDSGSVGWTLVDKPSVTTGSYTSTATFTISAS